MSIQCIYPVVHLGSTTECHVDVNMASPDWHEQAAPWTVAGDIHAEVSADVDLNSVIEFVKQVRARIAGEFLSNIDAVFKVLNSGAVQVCLPLNVFYEYESELSQISIFSCNLILLAKVPHHRVALVVQSLDDIPSNHNHDVLVDANQATLTPEIVASLKDQCVNSEQTLAFTNITSIPLIQAIDRIGGQALISVSVLSTELSLAKAIASILTTDRPDGLWTTLVVNERYEALGVCYSSNESLEEAIRLREGVYHSRKRGLWHKGATSGATQTLHTISYDCDRDLLQFRVTQHKEGFCHRSIASCTGPNHGLSLLQTTLQSRLSHAPEGSYTKRLFEEPGLLQKKVVEEAIELTEAKDPDHIASEMADLLYFALATCIKSGVTLDQVEKKLDRRQLQVNRRPGKAKEDFLKKKLESLALSSAIPQETIKKDVAPYPSPTLTTPTPAQEKEKLRRLTTKEIPPLHRDPVNPKARAIAEEIMQDVRIRGEEAMLEHAIRLGDLQTGAPHIIRPPELKSAFDTLDEREQKVLQRTAERIRKFAQAQRASIQDKCTIPIPGGQAGQNVAAVESAGCYAPGGRYPLPSSVLMGAVTARVAGVQTVWVASPRPHQSVLAAAHVAGVDGMLAVGGVQAIAAFAYGAGQVPVCDAIVGPGNMFVTAAKSLVAGSVAIDMLAGPSECLIIADETCDAAVVASDLLAQSEHDVAARAILVTPSEVVADAVEANLFSQLSDLPTQDTARVAVMKNSFTVVTQNIAEAVEVANSIAPEHLEIHTANASQIATQCQHYGGLFVGHHAAEVLGDYGAGPNHTLPTGGTARSFGGLSVHTFLRQRTWMSIDDVDEAKELIQDAVDLALIEGLHGHSRAAAKRLPSKQFV